MPNDPTIHIIDDDDAARDSIIFLLAAAGFSVQAHASARAFLAVFSGDAGCIVTDLRMPEMNGFDLLHHLKRGKVECPVIVMTAQADVAAAIEAIRLGAFDFIEKPFDPDILIDAVKITLGGRTEATQSDQKAEIQRRLATLHPLERRLLDAIVEGRLDNLIEEEPGLNERTLALHRANVMSKMQARGLAHLVRLALIAGS